MVFGKQKSPLGDKQDELARQEAALKRQMEELENLIETAPQKIAEHKKRQRERILQQATSGGNRLEVPASLRGNDLLDNSTRGKSQNRPRLKAEQQALKLRVIGLLVLFLALVALLVTMVF